MGRFAFSLTRSQNNGWIVEVADNCDPSDMGVGFDEKHVAGSDLGLIDLLRDLIQARGPKRPD